MATEWDVTEETPLDLTGLGETIASQTYAPPSMRWDCSIGGLPFLFGMSDQYPLQRETADFRRQRIDNEREPGEQSLDSGYWIRSQSSWHYGSGITTAEPLETNDTEARFRFESSGGVDPWDAGKAKLLHDTEKVYSSTAASQLMLGVDTGVLHATGNQMKHIANNGTVTTVTWGPTMAGDILSLSSNGTNWFLSDDDGYYMGTLPYGSGTKIYETVVGNNDRTLVRWLKNRLFVVDNHKIYEVAVLAGGGAKISTTNLIFTHINASWVWSDISDGPAAVYASGYAGDVSQIYKFAAGAEGTTSVSISGGSVVAEMPRGEKILSMYSYLGSYLAIGTNKGLRIAAIASDGSLSLGPLVHETSDGVYDMVAVGNYMWFTVGSKGSAGDSTTRAGLYRIDLGQTINDTELDFAHAADLVVPDATSTGQATQVTVSDSKVWFVVTGSNGGVFKEKTTYVPTGWFTTGRIRLATIEPKAWRDVRVIEEETVVPAQSLGITNKSLSSNVATLTTASTHYLRAGQTVTVASVDATFNGTYSVTSVPTSTTFTYAKIAADVASTVVTPSGTLTWQPDVTSTAHASTSGNGTYSSWTEVIKVNQSGADKYGSLNSVTDVPAANMYLAFRLDTFNVNYTPSLIGYQVRAIPAPARSRLLRIPVLVYDFEIDRTGLRYGRKGGAWLRLSKLEQLENSAATVSYFDYTTDERKEAYIERVTYTRTTPPTRSQSGNGGIAQITLRLL